jgi:hypothetical protein
MPSSPSRILGAAVLGAALLLAGGCASGPSPRAYAVKVSLDPTLAGSSVQVDLIGANPISDVPRLESYPVSEYWKPGDVLRRDSAKISFAFGQGRPDSQVLEMKNPIWTKWLQTGAQNLIVIADIPGVTADPPRRLNLPLDANQWGKTDTLDILVQESGIRVVTPKKP